MDKPNPKLTKRHGFIVRQRLRGKTLREIAPAMALTFQRVHQLFKEIEPSLGESTKHRIKVAKVDARLPRDIGPRVVAAFREHLFKSPHGHGVLQAAAKSLGVSYDAFKRRLALEGINFRGEIRRKKAQLAQTISQTRSLPIADVARETGVSEELISKYRHLEYRDLEPLSLKKRNKAVEWNLPKFDESLKAARGKVLQLHPVNPVNRTAKARRAFKQAKNVLNKLKAKRDAYVDRELAFRQKHGLPLHPALK